jgi:hypothetical protein
MSPIAILALVLVGFCFGFLCFLGFQLYKLYKRGKKLNQELAQLDKEMSNLPPRHMTKSVLERLKKAGECTQEQNAIAAQHSMPSSNALHSKYKNQLASRFKQLEEEKLEILRSIVTDGFDPMVMCFNNSTQQNEEILLSEFLKIASGESPTQKITDGPEVEPPANVEPESIKKVVKNGKTFFLIEGGKTTTQ